MIAQENVESFDLRELLVHLGHRYHVDLGDSSIVNPSDFGFPVERKRRWTVMRHRYKTKAWKSPWNSFTHLFQAQPLMGFSFSDSRPQWDAFFCSTAHDLWQELQWAAHRPESRLQTVLKWDSFEEFHADLKNPQSEPVVWEFFLQALTTVEADFLNTYRERRPGVAYSLNQNPEVSQTDSHLHTLHTVIKNAGIIWCLFQDISTFLIL